MVIVVRAGDPLDWLPEEALGAIPAGRCRIEVCADAELGMAHSLRTGIQAAEAIGAEGIMVMLADQPFVDEDMLNKLIRTYDQNDDFDYIASGDEGLPKPPVVLGRSMWAEAASLVGDVGARSLFRSPKYRGCVVEEKNEWKFMDVDTPELYKEAKKTFTHNCM
ncbi:NTP transferase domain-containing protein [Paenibacillus sp. N3.4]|uniref:nucleotidyltransferase family protein n=1 Tax=Paenibacillus sp. N3.4 TaxID=2603222 RepID=UPI0011CADA86|nr:NTP transferase domain-containing protein [Paenibacillus sp. N3.4]TXK73762.1 NTP transferase domain-containing protein [Paenibacillus sp. N3.4]